MLLDRQDNLWIGTNKGVSRYDGNAFVHYTTADGLAGDDVRSMLEDSQGYLWFGTTEGASRFDPEEERFIKYTTESGLSNNLIWSLREDDRNNIWISTEKGITLMIPLDAEQGDYQIFTFDKGDGLKRIDFQANSAYLDDKNRLWWGSEGLTMLDLNQFQLPQGPPRGPLLTHVEIDQQFVDFRRLRDTAYQAGFPFGKDLFQAFDSVTLHHNYPDGMRLPHNSEPPDFPLLRHRLGRTTQDRIPVFPGRAG